MATEILPVASSAANSSDLPVASGSTVTVCLKGTVDAKARVLITLKDDANGYNNVGELTSFEPALAISAPGTYRFTRIAGATCGVFSA